MTEPVPNLRMVAPSPRFSRVVIGLLGCSHLLLGYYSSQLGYLPGAVWWALVFVMAALFCWAFAATMHPTASILAGAATVTAYAFRIGALLVGWIDGNRTLTFAQMMSGVVSFSTLILAWGPVFWKITVPNAAIRQLARDVDEQG